jgi:hypothetical protein
MKAHVEALTGHCHSVNEEKQRLSSKLNETQSELTAGG